MDGSVVVQTPAKDQLSILLQGIDSGTKVGGEKGREAWLDDVKEIIAAMIDQSCLMGADPCVYVFASYGLAKVREELAKREAYKSN